MPYLTVRATEGTDKRISDQDCLVIATIPLCLFVSVTTDYELFSRSRQRSR